MLLAFSTLAQEGTAVVPDLYFYVLNPIFKIRIKFMIDFKFCTVMSMYKTRLGSKRVNGGIWGKNRPLGGI